MEQTYIETMKTTNRVKLPRLLLIRHYTAVLLLIALAVFFVVTGLEIIYIKEVLFPERVLRIAGLFLLSGLILGVLQHRRLSFKRFDVTLSISDFKIIVEQTARAQNWGVIQLEKDYALIITGFSWYSWGERITLIRKDHELLINSICDPDNMHSVIDWGKNNRNIQTLLKRIPATP